MKTRVGEASSKRHRVRLHTSCSEDRPTTLAVREQHRAASKMFFFFTCGEHTFRKEVDGYEGMVCQCYNCGNMAGRVIKSHPWFTICWIVCSPASRRLLLRLMRLSFYSLPAKVESAQRLAL